MTRSEATSLAGLPLSSWSFALRTFASMMAALYAAFWLQLEGASSAMVCAAILAAPTRGHVFQKAANRLVGTAIGVIASIVIAALFAQVRELFILVFAIWLGLCVYVASFFGGFRAYAAVLSGYTVAIVAVMQIETPQDIFSAGVNRGAAIAIGVAAVALVDDMFAAPNIYPGLASRIRGLHRSVNELSLRWLREGRFDQKPMAATLDQITALHADITDLAAEASAGRVRASAARSVAAAMVEQIAAARMFLRAQRAGGADLSALRDRLASILEERSRNFGARRQDLESEFSDLARSPEEEAGAWLAVDLLQSERLVANGLCDMEADRTPERNVRLRLHRVRQVAIRNAIRSFILVVVAATLFSFTGWPQTIVSVAFVGVLAGFGTTTPSPHTFAKLAVFAIPIAAALTGVMEFFVLDGADDFPVFMLAMAPPIFVICFVISSSNPALKAMGMLVMVFFCVLLAPSNPQTYNPENFLFSSVLTISAVALIFVLQQTILPTRDEQRRQWLLEAARSDLREACANLRSEPEAERAYRAGDRLAQLGRLTAENDVAGRESLVEMLFLDDLAAAVARAHGVLDHRLGLPDAVASIRDARAGLSRLDSGLLRKAAADIADLEAAGAVVEATCVRAAVAALTWASLLIASEPARVREIAEC